MSVVTIACVVSAYENPRHRGRLVHRVHTGSETGFVRHIDRSTFDPAVDQEVTNPIDDSPLR
jgi:hypothetical protein